MKKLLKVGIIGTGSIAQAHIDAYNKLRGSENVQVIAIADIVPAKAEETAKTWDIPNVFGDYRKLLEIDEIDLVSICTSKRAHCAPALAALAAEKHVLLEKPIAATLKDATAIARAAHHSDKVVQLAITPRFNPEMKVIKAIVESGTLGNIYYAETVGASRRASLPLSIFSKKASGRGVVIESGVYNLDTALWIMGFPKPISVLGIVSDWVSKHAKPPIHYPEQQINPWTGKTDFSWSWDAKKVEVEDFAVAWIKMENDSVLLLKMSWAMHMDSMGSTFFLGTKGGLKLSPLQVYRDEFGCLVNVTPQEIPGPYDHQERFVHTIRPFLRAIREGLASPVPVEELLLTNVIADGVYRSARVGHEVEVFVPQLD